MFIFYFFNSCPSKPAMGFLPSDTTIINAGFFKTVLYSLFCGLKDNFLSCFNICRNNFYFFASYSGPSSILVKFNNGSGVCGTVTHLLPTMCSKIFKSTVSMGWVGWFHSLGAYIKAPALTRKLGVSQ